VRLCPLDLSGMICFIALAGIVVLATTVLRHEEERGHFQFVGLIRFIRCGCGSTYACVHPIHILPRSTILASSLLTYTVCTVVTNDSFCVSIYRKKKENAYNPS
jgi:hypothetical protein